MTLRVSAPVGGDVVPLSEVPDAVFAQAMVGPGLAVRPAAGSSVDAVAPIAGIVVTLHPHAFVVATAGGTAILVHLGIDTVKLRGAGFTVHVAKGDTVEAGQRLVTWNPDSVAAQGFSTMCPIIALDATAEALAEVRDAGSVAPGDTLFTWRSTEHP